MNLEVLYSKISPNQRKIVDALLAHPEGLLSDELAEITGVSNKSHTMCNDLREKLEEHGLKLYIKREGVRSRWYIREVPTEITLNRKKLSQLENSINQLSIACDKIKKMLNITE